VEHISRVVVSTPDSYGNATVYWHGFTRTRKTHSGDIWWPSFKFKTAYGTTLLWITVQLSAGVRIGPSTGARLATRSALLGVGHLLTTTA
jgi:hypothetical protein